MVNLTSFLAVKQLFKNVTEYLEEKREVSSAIKDVQQLFEKKIEEAKNAQDAMEVADLQMHEEI